MDYASVIVAIVGALAGPAASVKVASFSASRTLDDIHKRLEKMDERLKAQEGVKLADVQALQREVKEIRALVESLPGQVGSLRVAFEEYKLFEERRRERNLDRSEREREIRTEWEKRYGEKLGALLALVEHLKEEFRELRGAGG